MIDYKYSIVTPSHVYSPHLLELFESIKAQRYTHWEWVLYLNNGFEKAQVPDEILQHPKVQVYSNYTGIDRIGYLKKKACNRATGDIIVEVDHDDILTDDCLLELNKAFQDPSYGFVYSDAAVYHMKDKFTPYSDSYGWSYYNYDWRGKSLIAMRSFEPTSHALSYIWFAPDHVRAWRRQVYEAIGGHDITMDVCDDHDLLIKTYFNTKMHYIPKVLYIYRITGDNSWLKRNEKIQTKTVELHDKYAQLLAEKDADSNGLMKIDLGGALHPREGYTTIDIYDADIVCDLNNGIPLEDNSVGVINASHVLEHLREPIKAMREIHRVLAHGGWAFIEVPSTDGRGAWQDPTHVSFWNENSFHYYTRKTQAQYIRNTTIRFAEMRLHTHWWDNKVAITNANLVALKEGPRYPGLVQI